MFSKFSDGIFLVMSKIHKQAGAKFCQAQFSYASDTLASACLANASWIRLDKLVGID